MQIYFDKLHDSCPEQYDVYKDSSLVGAIWLRYGELRMYIDNHIVYTHNFNEPFKGSFSSEIEREHYLAKFTRMLNGQPTYEQSN